jgi:hypothetical protein
VHALPLNLIALREGRPPSRLAGRLIRVRTLANLLISVDNIR